MMRSSMVVTGLWLYSTFLLLAAPATVVDAGLARIAAGRVRLVAAQGTLWAGTGRLELRDAADRAIFATPARWQLAPRSWLSAHLGWHIELAAQAQPMQVAVNLRSIELRDVDLDLPAAAVSALVPALSGYGLGGLLQLRADNFSFGADAGGSASVQWLDASTVLAPVAPLGSYEVLLAGTAGDLALSLGTRAGPLQLEGKGRADAGQGLSYDIVATLPPGELEQLVPFLQLVAVEAADGTFVLQHH